MDTSTLPATPVVTAAPGADCQMCGHSAAEHDPLARRFCDATATATLTRGCICR